MDYKPTTSDECREIFNRHEFWERAQSGEFTERILWQGGTKRKGDLKGTRSQTVGYFQGDRRVALVHQNVHTRSKRVRGRPDPITVLHNGVLYDCSDEHGPRPG